MKTKSKITPKPQKIGTYLKRKPYFWLPPDYSNIYLKYYIVFGKGSEEKHFQYQEI